MLRLSALALVVAALAGCADGPGASYGISPPRRTVWQQFCEQAWSVQQASALVMARGADGWELVSMYNGALCYKRPAGEPVARPLQQQTSSPTSPYVPVLRDPGF